MPDSVSMPVPVLTSAPPIPSIVPATVVDWLLPPTVIVFVPKLNVPVPLIEPAVVPADVRVEKSTTPPAKVLRVALPPLLVSKNWTNCRVTSALLAVLLLKNCRTPLPLNAALPALLALLNVAVLFTKILAVPAELVSLNTTAGLPLKALICAFPAVLELLK
ncbi:hypothetical protein ACVWXL_002877 [Bradyrhizobium sp. GM22.5]